MVRMSVSIILNALQEIGEDLDKREFNHHFNQLQLYM